MSKLIIDAQTNEQTVRELTDEELKQQIIDEKNEIKEAKAHEAKGAAKAKAKAELLDRLGITEDEAKLLLA